MERGSNKPSYVRHAHCVFRNTRIAFQRGFYLGHLNGSSTPWNRQASILAHYWYWPAGGRRVERAATTTTSLSNSNSKHIICPRTASEVVKKADLPTSTSTSTSTWISTRRHQHQHEKKTKTKTNTTEQQTSTKKCGMIVLKTLL